MKEIVGVVHGRFQLLHSDHMKYIMAAYNKCDHLVIGICNPDYLHYKYSKENPHRSLRNANPFSYYERFQMIKGTLLDYGVSRDKFDIVPFPINMPDLIFNYTPRNAIYFMTIYDSWGYKKKKLLESIGCNVSVLWETDLNGKGISGSDVRRLITEGNAWQEYVPDFVYHYIIEQGLTQRIVSLNDD